MSTHHICFCGEIIKILSGYPLLFGAMKAGGVYNLDISRTISCTLK